MSELVDRELDRLRHERDEARERAERPMCDCHTWPTFEEMHAYVVAVEDQRDEAQAEAERLRESQRMLLHDAVDHGRNHTAELVDCDDMSCAQARAALEAAPGPAGERQEAVVKMDEDSDLHKLLERHDG